MKKYRSNSFNRGEGICLFPGGCADEMPVYPDPTEALARKRAGQQAADEESNWSANASVGLFCFLACVGFSLERDGLKLQVACCGLGVSGPGAGVGAQYAEGNVRPVTGQVCFGLANNGCLQGGVTDKGQPSLAGSINTGPMVFVGGVWTIDLPPPS
jgi:hypothetical protein